MNKTKQLLNLSESKMYYDFKRATNHCDINILPQIQMKIVIDSKELKLNKKEKQTYKDSSFDFVMADLEMNPLFVVEFDGPDHVRYKNILADLRKMSICQQAGLPILRINYKIYDEFAKDSLIDFLIFRYTKWNEESVELENEYSEKIEYLKKTGKSHEEIIDYMCVEEPEIVFNYRYYFPKIDEIRRKLYQNFNIFPDFFDSYPESTFMSKYTQITSSSPTLKNGQAISDSSYTITGRITKKGKVIDYEKTFKTEPVNIIWLYNYYDLVSIDDMETIVSSSGSYKNGIPGTQLYDLSAMLAEYRCFKEMLNEVKELKRKGFEFINEGNDDLKLFFENDAL